MHLFKKIVTTALVVSLLLATGCFGGEQEKGDPTTCTVEIRCDRLLDPDTKLKSGVEEYVPKDGILLEKKEVVADTSQSILEVTRDICKEEDISFVYNGKVNGETGYVEGIGSIFEKDAGKTSGWMYLLNGKTTNDSASALKVQDGDEILWYYVRNYSDEP